MNAMRNLDPRLAALLPVIDELRALRAYLAKLKPSFEANDAGQAVAAEDASQPPYWRAVQWIDDAIDDIAPYVHSRSWPPVWWRLGKVTLDPVFRNIRRADANGLFFGAAARGEIYIPERAHILAWVDRIEAVYEAAKNVRAA